MEYQISPLGVKSRDLGSCLNLACTFSCLAIKTSWKLAAVNNIEWQIDTNSINGSAMATIKKPVLSILPIVETNRID